LKLLAEKVWPVDKHKLTELTRKMKPVAVTGLQLASYQNTPSVRPGSLTGAQLVTIKIPSAVSRDHLNKLKKYLQQHNRGSETGLRVQLAVPQNGTLRLVTTSYYLPRNEEALAVLAQLVGQEAIRYR
jgi:hypothetical protein